MIRALQAGAKAYLLKDSAEADLIAAISAVRDGKSFFSPAVSHLLLEDYVRQMKQKGAVDSYELLTNREREIFQLVAEGKANKEIAALLNLSPYTVDTHRTRILQKLNLHSIPELVLYAVRKGIVGLTGFFKSNIQSSRDGSRDGLPLGSRGEPNPIPIER